MKAIVVVFVAAVLLGAFTIQAKFISILWRANIDNWKAMPPTAARVALGILIVATIIWLALSIHFDGLFRR